jgi:hypothetical protein
MRRLALAVLLLCALGRVPAAADEPRLPGEAAELTPEVRAKAQPHVDAIVAGKEPGKAAQALLRLGPAAWPVVEEKARIVVDPAPRPWLQYLRALLVPQSDPDFEELRRRLRRTILSGRVEAIASDLQAFRRGRPDPEKRGRTLPHATPPTDVPGGARQHRSPDGSFVLVFGSEGTKEKPDGGDASAQDPMAGFVAAVGGHGVPAESVSGRGGNASAVADNGFAFAYAQDGAPGQKPDGQGGDGGTADGRGEAGTHVRQGKMGKSAGE